MRIAEELKTIGTSLFKKGNLDKAQQKCRSEFRACLLPF